MQPIHLEPWVALVGTVVTVLGSSWALWVTISKYFTEAKQQRLEASNNSRELIRTVEELVVEVKELKHQNKEQELDIKINKEIAQSYFRMSLYNALSHALKRGYTTGNEVTEITKMYAIYKKNGGNGEIEHLHNHYEKLKVKEDVYETKQ